MKSAGDTFTFIITIKVLLTSSFNETEKSEIIYKISLIVSEGKVIVYIDFELVRRA